MPLGAPAWSAIADLLDLMLGVTGMLCKASAMLVIAQHSQRIMLMTRKQCALSHATAGMQVVCSVAWVASTSDIVLWQPSRDMIVCEENYRVFFLPRR